ncbi:lipid-binding SYLF domain-containing protein [Rubellicoccus peritrichatus]|uniref:Lipid-binding SYLF domain-containing protein n=1 Tax=Rubellicoccus peritrichatus TaxID=3080537 RepID=A0AAQ3LE25_9BACT|nr:lipid-binding SYLF domain-containing protein [Puniceicoccus sp. CR14]WOO42235.1 lipid-binding SYLF domain-containing protein [Puniceicoccus sp. CR14]
MKNLSHLFVTILIGITPFFAAAEDSLPVRTDTAIQILQKIAISDKPIPQVVLDEAVGVAIVKIVRGGFIVGGQHGNGIILKHLGGGKWSAPLAFDMGGGSFGAQIGGDVVDYVFVLNNDVALEMFTSSNEVKFDAGAAATAGPDNATANKKDLPGKSIYVYSTTDGAFAGATVGGSYIKVEPEVNQATYGMEVTTEQILSGKVKGLPSSKKLVALLNGKS